MKQLAWWFGVAAFSFSLLAGDSPTKLKLGLEAGLSYSSNPYSLVNPVGDMMTRIAPRLSLTTQGRNLSLGIDANGNMGATFGLNGNPGFLIFTGAAGGSSMYNPNGSVSFFTRAGLSASRNLGELFVGNMTNVSGTVALGSTITPGAGKFSFTGQGEYLVQGYPGLTINNQASTPRQLNNQSYYLAGRLSWRFLPKTALYSEARYGFFENTDANAIHLTINPLWVGGGLSGQITPRLVANISAHFSKIFIKGGPQTFASTSIPFGAKIDLSWTLPSESSLGVSLGREITPTPIFLDQASNLLAVNYSQTLWRKFVLTVNPQAGLLEYGKPYTSSDLGGLQYRTQAGTGNRLDFFTGVSLGLSYSFNSWLAVGASGDGFWRWTNADPTQALNQNGWISNGGGGNYQSLFNRYQGNVFVRLTY